MRSFEYLMYRAFSLSLLIVLVLLPLAPLFASETEAIVEPHVEEVVATEEIETLEVENDAPQIEPVLVESIISETELIDEPAETIDTTATDTTTEIETEELEATTTNAVNDTLDELEDETTTATTSEIENPILEEEATSTEDITVEEPIDEIIEDEQVGTTSIEIVPDESHMVTIGIPVTDENKFSFSKNECVSVSDGSFYCTNATATPSVIGTDRVFSAPDSEGDKEIYIEKGGEVVQITSNQLDDDAPFYDERSNTIVWHRLVSERYQIISYNLDDAEETQITNDRYNNMDPSRAGELTVWQGWVGNDWEVMLFDGNDISMVTDNVTEDIAPRINDNYIIWQAFEENAWRVKVYDRVTKSINTIEDSEGGSLANPRFVLVYDTEHENGDIETKGYDLRTGEVTPLGATPAPMPENIPDPEQTGEERALVQTATQIKTKTETEPDDDTEPEVLPNNEGVATSTESELSDIVIPPFVESSATSTDTTNTALEVIEEAQNIAEDIIVTSLEDASATATEHILDVIVTPYTEPIVEP